MARALGAASAAQKIVTSVANGEFADAEAAVAAHPNWEAGLPVVEKAAGRSDSGKPTPVGTGSGPALLSR